MEKTTSRTRTIVTADAPRVFTGGASTPPSASTGTQSATARVQAETKANNFRIVLSPSFKDRSSVCIVQHEPDEDSLTFLDLLRCDPSEALRFCDERLRSLPAGSFQSALRWSSGVGVALRALRDLRGAYRTHLLAGQTASLVHDPLTLGKHHHGLAFTQMELGEHVSALAGFQQARSLYLHAGSPAHVASADNNAGLVLVRLNRAKEALEHIHSALAVAERLGEHALVIEFADTLGQAHAALLAKENALR